MTSINTEISNVLAQIRALSEGINSQSPIQPNPGANAESVGFGSVLKHAVNSVSEQQQVAEAAASRFQAGDANTSIAEVVVEMQKASVSFQAMAEARNRIVDAYREIMNMSV
jgi:flagellar hook-basal body complex protein FliE